MKESKIAIIGVGLVGSTIAYSLILKNIMAEIILVDVDKKRCKGEVLDLSDALFFSETTQIRNGSMTDAQEADIIIIAAGKKQLIGQSRIALAQDNKAVISSILKSITPTQPHAIIIIVTNPVDIITYYAQQQSNLPKNQVFGSGTYLDSQRLRTLLAHKIGISVQSVEAYIIGEHGDSQIPLWSTAHVNGVSIEKIPIITKNDLEYFGDQVKQTAYQIIECKGATYYGIAACITDICEAILFDQKKILPLSCYQEAYDICFSTPAILGRAGIISSFPLEFSVHEKELLKNSIKKLNEVKSSLNSMEIKK